MDSTPTKVSIVIPAYNAEKTIAPLLESLLDLDYVGYDITVVNDGSVDRTRDIIRRYPVRLVDQPNRGASAARDAGFRLASAEIVAYVDSDVIVTRDWLTNLIVPFSDAKVGATTGQTIFLRNEKCTSWVRSLDIERRNARRRMYTHLANGPNSAFRREVLLKSGGFDPRWYHAEDTEVSYRILKQGHQIRYVPDAIVYHVPEDSWPNFLRKRYRDAKAFTRMLARYTRAAMFEDDYVSLTMKLQPPIFLTTLLVGALSLLFLPTPLGPLALSAFALLSLLEVFVNIPEAVAVARASGRIVFFFKGLALGLMRGFAWGLGLGVGGVSNIAQKWVRRTHGAW